MIRFGLNVGYSGAQLSVDMDLVREAERLGFHSVWTAEAYGSDAVTPLAWIGGQTSKIRLGSAIMQMAARTPALTASTATSLDQLSGGRFLLGLGVSGPQVVEGWHGQPFGKPLTRTREYVEIVRAIWARERPLEHQGEHYQIPYRGAGATGLGKPLRSILHGRQIPIYIAATRPKSVAGGRDRRRLARGLVLALPHRLLPRRARIGLPARGRREVARQLRRGARSHRDPGR